jgi:hypothetical protein
VRLSPITVAVAVGAVGCMVLLAGIVFDFDGPGAPERPATVDAAPAPRTAAGQPAAARRRTRQVPRFERAPAPPPSLPPTTAAPENQEIRELKERASKDGFLFREAGSQDLYVVQHGTRFPVKSAEELRVLGLDPSTIQEVPPGSLKFLRNQPPDRTFWKESDRAEVYYYENGQKRWITGEAFDRGGYSYKDIRVLPAGALKDHTTGAPILR